MEAMAVHKMLEYVYIVGPSTRKKCMILNNVHICNR